MTDRGPRKRKAKDHRGEQSHRGEARRYLGTPMQHAMIRGLDDETRARCWLAVANEKVQEGEIGRGIVERIAEKVRESTD